MVTEPVDLLSIAIVPAVLVIFAVLSMEVPLLRSMTPNIGGGPVIETGGLYDEVIFAIEFLHLGRMITPLCPIGCYKALTDFRLALLVFIKAFISRLSLSVKGVLLIMKSTPAGSFM